MLNIWKYVFPLVALFVLALDARPPSSEISSNTAKQLDCLVRAGGLGFPENGTKRAAKGKKKKKKKWSKEDLDAKKIDVNSDLFLVIEGMAINGKLIRDNLRSREKGSNKAMALERKFLKDKTKGKKGNVKEKTKRNFINRYDSYGNDYYWPDGIVPYYVNYSIFGVNSANAQAKIEEAAAEFQTKTCVKLVRKTLDEIATEGIPYYVNITSDSGCWSFIGRVLRKKGLGQELNLQASECLWKSTVIHEFCHALGMNHEQSRSDRDNHLKVLFENINEDKKYNLEKEKTLDNNPYDYYSLMQYGLYSFTSKSWEKTMEFRDPELEFLAGGSPELSFYDTMDITKGYRCSAKCQQTDDACKNGGFVDHNCECFCPEGLKGTDCNTIESDTCGGIIDLQPGTEKVIQSPNYPNNYDTGKKCYWLLRAQNNQRIMIYMNDFDISSGYSYCYHWLEIRYNLVGQPSRKNCGNQFYANKITSTEYGNPELMMLVLDTATITGAPARKGFSLKAKAFEITSIGCSAPPTLPHSSNNHATEGSSVGAIIRYECNYGYHMVGSGISVTCQADATWSAVGFKCEPRNNVFKCDFENGNCNVTLSTSDFGTHKWKIQTQDGNSFFTLSPATTPEYHEEAMFRLPKGVVNRNKDYCLSFKFKRTSSVSLCAYLYVGEPQNNRRWRYYDCSSTGDWEIFQGNISPWYSNTELTELIFTASASANAEMNINIDDIHLSDGFC